MPITEIFKLAKLTILAFKDSARTAPIDAIEVMYNPDSLSRRFASEFQGDTDGKAQWTRSRTSNLDVKLVIDGTRVSFHGVEQLRGLDSVAKQVQRLLALCYEVNTDTHQPSFLTLHWGSNVFGLDGFECRLEHVDINYTSFDRDGSPLRAELAVTFVRDVDPPKKPEVSSPDLTHRRLVRPGDTLPLLCSEIYGSAAHYLRVAEVNRLNDFRSLVPGQELFFPPFARKERG